jgi:hypothetical protein
MICSYKLVIKVGSADKNDHWDKQGKIESSLRAQFSGVKCLNAYYNDDKEYTVEWRVVGTPEMITWFGLQERIVKVKKQGFVRNG